MRDETDPALYEIPIDVLGLSDDVIDALHRGGLLTVGDCIDFSKTVLVADTPPIPIGIRGGDLNLMYEEMIPRLIELGYLNKDGSVPKGED